MKAKGARSASTYRGARRNAKFNRKPVGNGKAKKEECHEVKQLAP